MNTVECTDVGLCQIIVAVSDDGFDSCTGLLPDGSNNNAARRTIDVDCTVAQGCGNDQIDPGEDCDPPDGVFCDDNCQDIDNCSPDPCNQGNVCSPEVCTANPDDNSAICTADPGSAAGNACSPPAAAGPATVRATVSPVRKTATVKTTTSAPTTRALRARVSSPTTTATSVRSAACPAPATRVPAKAFAPASSAPI